MALIGRYSDGPHVRWHVSIQGTCSHVIAADLRPDVFLWVCMMDIAVDQGFLRQRLPSKDVSTTRALDRYDPTYDPLLASTPGCGQDYSPTYWIATAGEPPADDGPIDSDREVDVAIIGSGFTGLSAAIALARDHGVRSTVLEANRVSWGCSVRNGGQAQCASGRLTRSQWIARWGLDTALALHAECLDGMEYFKQLIADIDCDVQPGGHLYVAHRAARMPMLEREAKVLREVFDYDAQIVHPAKLAFGYLKKARALGATVHPASPVQGWVTKDGWHHLQTPGGVVRARAVAVATGGYTSQTLHPRLRNRLMPILSNSVVTRQLTPEEIEANGLRTHQVITDTRVLRHYYRLTPDGRLQIGSRSAINGRGAPDKRYERMLLDGMVRKFPGLRDVSIDYSWWGWVDVSHDMMPRIVQPDPHVAIYYALGYGGNGVMYAAQAGRRLAQGIAGAGGSLRLPIFQGQLPFPNVAGVITSEWFAPFRRLGQRALYRWYHLKDEVL